MAGERTEQATQHRRDKARKDGDILHSRELSAAAGMLAGVMVLGAMGGHLLILWRNSFASFLDLGQPARWEPAELQPTLLAIRSLTFTILGPPALIIAAVAAAALGIGVLQTGGVNFNAGAIGFKLDRVARRREAGQVADPGQPACGLCRAAHRQAVDPAAVFDDPS